MARQSRGLVDEAGTVRQGRDVADEERWGADIADETNMVGRGGAGHMGCG